MNSTMTISAANYLAKVEPHAAALEKTADRMNDEGIGGHATRGLAAVLRDMAGKMRADAAQALAPGRSTVTYRRCGSFSG